jgi:hypothetical protein
MRRQRERLAAGPEDRPGAAAAMTRRSAPRLVVLPRRTTWVELGGRRIAHAIDAAGDRAAALGDLPIPTG